MSGKLANSRSEKRERHKLAWNSKVKTWKRWREDVVVLVLHGRRIGFPVSVPDNSNGYKVLPHWRNGLENGKCMPALMKMQKD